MIAPVIAWTNSAHMFDGLTFNVCNARQAPLAGWGRLFKRIILRSFCCLSAMRLLSRARLRSSSSSWRCKEQRTICQDIFIRKRACGVVPVDVEAIIYLNVKLLPDLCDLLCRSPITALRYPEEVHRCCLLIGFEADFLIADKYDLQL